MGKLHARARACEHGDRGRADVGALVRRPGIREQGDPGRSRALRQRRERAVQRRGHARKPAATVDAHRRLGQAARGAGARDGVDEAGSARRRGEPGARVGGGALAQREAVLGAALGEHLGLHRRHVDPRRALGLARLAPDAEGEDLPQALAGQRRPRQRAVHDRAQGVGAGAGGVALVAGGHVGRAHRPAGALAAQAGAVAELDRRLEPALAREVERGGRRAGAEAGPEAQLLLQRARRHDDARVEQAGGVPGPLERGEGLDQLAARTCARGTPSATGRRRARPRSTRPARPRGRQRARRCGASGRRRPGPWCSAPGARAGSPPRRGRRSTPTCARARPAPRSGPRTPPAARAARRRPRRTRPASAPRSRPGAAAGSPCAAPPCGPRRARAARRCAPPPRRVRPRPARPCARPPRRPRRCTRPAAPPPGHRTRTRWRRGRRGWPARARGPRDRAAPRRTGRCPARAAWRRPPQ